MRLHIKQSVNTVRNHFLSWNSEF